MKINNYENSKFVRFAYRFKDYNYLRLKMLVKFWLIFIGLIVFIILNIIQVIQIRVFFGKENSSFLWLILNALVWNVYLNALGIFNTGMRKSLTKYVVLFIALLVILLGFGYFDITIRINIWILAYKDFSTSSANGIWFFWSNIYLWTPIYFITFLIESDTIEYNF